MAHPFFKAFTGRPVIFPVIHVVDESQVARNVETCLNCGIQEVFLIDHNNRPNSYLFEQCRLVKERWPGTWVGINLLQSEPWDCFETCRQYHLDSRWLDGFGVKPNDCQVAERVMVASDLADYPGMIFGGVAFKYIDSGSEFFLSKRR